MLCSDSQIFYCLIDFKFSLFGLITKPIRLSSHSRNHQINNENHEGLEKIQGVIVLRTLFYLSHGFPQLIYHLGLRG